MSDDPGSTDSEGVPPSISQLIRSHQDRTGESLRRVSDRSHAATGRRVSQKYVHDLLHGRAKQWPKNSETILGLAAGLETTPLAIVLGFAVELLPEGSVRTATLAAAIPPAADNLPAHVRDALVGLTRALVSDGPPASRMSDGTIPDITDQDGLYGDPEPDSDTPRSEEA